MVLLPYRLAHRYRLVAADVQGVFDALVTAINGLLDASAFGSWMRLKNAHKVEQYGLVALHFAGNMGLTTKRVYLPIPGPGSCAEPIELTAVRWSFAAKNVGGINMAGSVKLYRNDAAGAEALVVTKVLVPATPNSLFNDAISSAPAGDFDSRMSIEVILTTGDTVNDWAATVWCKAKHVR